MQTCIECHQAAERTYYADDRSGPFCSLECEDRWTTRRSGYTRPPPTVVVGRLVHRLAHGPAGVSELASYSGCTGKSASRALCQLEDEGIVRRDHVYGPWELVQRG